MNHRLFSHYLLSGSIFFGWSLLFYCSYNIGSFDDIKGYILSLSIIHLLLLIMALISIGMIIHQFSMSIKNQLLGRYCDLPYFIDSIEDDDKLTQNIIKSYTHESLGNNRLKISMLHNQVNVIHQKLSGLNNLYYLRFDNGGLAPILAFITFVLINSIKENKLLPALLMILSIIFIAIISIKCFYPKKEQHPVVSIVLNVLSFAYTVIKIRQYYINKNYVKLFFIITFSILVLIKYVIKALIKFIIKHIGIVFLLISLIIMLSLLAYHGNMLSHIDNGGFIASLIIAIVSVFFMLSYIPIIYNERKKCFEYYEAFLDQNDDVTVYNSLPRYKKHNPSA